MKSVMTHNFSRIPKAEIQRSSFDRSHGLKTTLKDAGYLYPVFIDEALPGDTFNLNMNAFARISTPLKPVMDNIMMDSFFFAVPYRLVWENWQRFNGEQPDPGDSTDFVVPQMTAPPGVGVQNGELGDYMGIPTGVPGLKFNSLWHRAYSLIWNEWFRDQNLQGSITINKGDGPDDYASHILRVRGKRHDYFTSCLPWPQKGPDVVVPMGANAPVNRVSEANGWKVYAHGSNTLASDKTLKSDVQGLLEATDDEYRLSLDPNGGLLADLSAATAASVNAWREAFQLQRMYERDARGGTRYTEILKAHFGVTSPDARLQRPEYLGGGTSMVNMHPVPQTSGSPAAGYTDTVQGNLAAYGTGSFGGNGFTKSFTEHCLLIGLVSIRADLTYQTGLNRMFSRRTRYDFFWPALAHLGEQAVLNKELYAQGTTADDDVFGYQERYAEYRYKPSQICGQFRSNFATSLDIWHLSQDFSTLPTLGDAFIKENPPMDRIVAVPEEPKFLLDAYFQLKCARPMPVFGVPGMIDHF